MRRVTASVLCAVAACSGATPKPARVTAVACVELAPPAATRSAYGVVRDPDGAPIAGARVTVREWRYGGPVWRSAARAEAATGADGAYVIDVAMADAVVEYEHAGRTVVWTRVSGAAGAHRIDVVLDGRQPAGVIGVFDARTMVGSACGPWICPADRAPAAGWWTAATPCPAGAHLAFQSSREVPRIAVACVAADGVEHGAITQWGMGSDGGWVVSSAWYDRGEPCGWRDEPAAAPVAPEPDPEPEP
jgi:hypothetical protein